MKKILLTVIVALTILFAQAQTLCDPNMTYTTGSQYQLEIAIPVTGNSLPTMAPLYAVTYGNGNMLAEDSCFSGPCTHMVYNYNPNGTYYDTLTTCISYTLTDTVGYVDTLICCFFQYWDGSAWTVPGGTPTPSWDCSTNMPGGCYDPGTGLGQYSSLAACQAVCGTPTPSWDCGSQGCYDTGTGLGTYTSLAACQAVCASTVSNLCDSMTLISTGGSLQTILMAEVPNTNTIIDYWITTAPDGTVLGEDSMWNSHQIFNNMNNAQPYDTINICITYQDTGGYSTCCVTWIWDVNTQTWAKIGSITSIGEIGLFDKKIIKVVDVLGRETSINSNQTLFLIYENGTIEKRYIIDRK